MQKRVKLILATGLACLLSISFGAEPPNLALVKKTIAAYAENGQYIAEVTQQINQAEEYLQDRVKQNATLAQPKKLAVVLDIDETSLSNLAFIQQQGFDPTLATFVQYLKNGSQPAMKPTLALYDLAKHDDVAVFFVTGRKQNFMAITKKNLLAAGYNHWNGLYLESDNSHYTSAADFKAPTRQKIENMGYDIVLNIGDQESDLTRGFADKSVKLPNPFYYIA